MLAFEIALVLGVNVFDYYDLGCVRNRVKASRLFALVIVLVSFYPSLHLMTQEPLKKIEILGRFWLRSMLKYT